MGLVDKVKGAFFADGGKSVTPAAPALPSLDEIHNRIVKAKLNFRQTVSEAETASKKSQTIYSKLFEVAPAERDKLRKQKAEQDATVKRKMVQAQSFAKSLGVLQDVEIVMQIDEAFAQCGLTEAGKERSGSLESVQKSLEEASLIVTKTMEAVEKLGISISGPEFHSAPMSESEKELDELWKRYDSESDPAKKEEIQRRIQEKEATPQVALA